MKLLSVMGLVLFIQSQMNVEQAMQEIEAMDCQKMFETMSVQCLNQCDEMKQDPSMKGQAEACAKQCQDIMSDMLSGCSQSKKNIAEFRKKSPDEQKKILEKAAQESSHHH